MGIKENCKSNFRSVQFSSNRTPLHYLSQRIVFDNFLSAMAEVPCGLCDKHYDDTECVHCGDCDKWHHMKCVYDLFPVSRMV